MKTKVDAAINISGVVFILTVEIAQSNGNARLQNTHHYAARAHLGPRKYFFNTPFSVLMRHMRMAHGLPNPYSSRF